MCYVHCACVRVRVHPGSREEHLIAISPEDELASEAASNAPTLPPPPTGRPFTRSARLPVLSVTSLYIPFKFAHLPQHQLTQADQVKLMGKLMAYKTALKELASEYPSFGEPNTAITENVTVSDYQGDRTYMCVTLLVGVHAVSGTYNNNLIIIISHVNNNFLGK
jgi:hypothetical protein